MMKLKIVLLILALFLLVPSMVNAGAPTYTLAEIDAASLIKLFPSPNNVSGENSTNQAQASVIGNPTYSDTIKKVGSASVNLDGSDMLTFPTIEQYDALTNMTMCLWQNHTQGSLGIMTSTRGGSDESAVHSFRAEANGDILFFVFVGSDNKNLYFTDDGSIFDDANPELLCASINYTNGNMYMYLTVNGTSVADLTTASVAPQTLTGTPFYVGGKQTTASFTGMVDDVYWINLSLASSDIRTHFWNNGDGQKLQAAAPAATCDCPSSGSDWEINDGSTCQLTTACDIGTGRVRVNNGNLFIYSTLNSKSTFVDKQSKLYVDDVAGKLFCGN